MFPFLSNGPGPNCARWPNHPLWEIACAKMNCDLTEMRSGADPNPMKEVQREEHIGLIFQNILGSSIALEALHDTNVDGLGGIFDNWLPTDVRGQGSPRAGRQATPRRQGKVCVHQKARAANELTHAGQGFSDTCMTKLVSI